jgi:hypothetical protein
LLLYNYLTTCKDDYECKSAIKTLNNSVTKEWLIRDDSVKTIYIEEAIQDVNKDKFGNKL